MKVRLLFSIVSFWSLLAATAFAQTKLGEFRDWTAYAFDDSNGKMCTVIAAPLRSQYSQPIKGRGAVQFFVARFPARDIRSEPSTMIGYPFAPDAEVTVEIDGNSKFTMFTQEDFAWLSDKDDRTLVDAMRKGNEMVVEGKSRRGTITTDTYSLAGVSAALNAIREECP